MRKLSAAILIAAALCVGGTNAQPTPAAPTVKALQPGLLEVAGPRVIEAVGAGIQKITATPGKGSRSIEARSPYGNIYFDWPKDVKQVAFTIEADKSGRTATVSAPGLTEANKADYKAAIDAVVPRAIKTAHTQRERKSKQ